jgi:hypothetical protein
LAVESRRHLLYVRSVGDDRVAADLLDKQADGKQVGGRAAAYVLVED